jgi:hypothetical protein
LQYAQITRLCTPELMIAEADGSARNGGYLKSSLDNAWWAGISAA